MPMIMRAVKLNRGVLAAVFVVFALIVILILILPEGDRSAAMSVNFKNIRTNEDRIAFLEAFGWTVSSEAVRVEDVLIPREFDAVYNAYNEIQGKNGLNLERYKGKTLKKWTYIITNHPNAGGKTVFANLLIYKNRIVGGDISSAEINGFIHGFAEFPS